VNKNPFAAEFGYVYKYTTSYSILNFMLHPRLSLIFEDDFLWLFGSQITYFHLI